MYQVDYSMATLEQLVLLIELHGLAGDDRVQWQAVLQAI